MKIKQPYDMLFFMPDPVGGTDPSNPSNSNVEPIDFDFIERTYTRITFPGIDIPERPPKDPPPPPPPEDPPVPEKEEEEEDEKVEPKEWSKNHFCGAQTEIHVNGVLLGEAIEVEGVYHVDQLPVYNYASQHFTSVAQGRVMVTGSLLVNFTFHEYLAAHLMRGDKYRENYTRGNDKFATQITKNKPTSDYETNKYKNEIDSITGSLHDVGHYDEQRIPQNPPYSDLTLSTVQTLLKEQYWDNNNQVFSYLNAPARPEFFGPFNIVVRDFHIGYDPAKYEERTIVNCFIKLDSMVRRIDSNPHIVSYQYIAQTIV